MKTLCYPHRLVLCLAFVVNLIFLSTRCSAQPLADGLVAYWPLDVVIGDKTPDLVSGYDMSAYAGASHTLTNGSAIVLTSGYRSNCVSFDVAKQTLLGYIAGPADDLPINKHAALTISFWVNAPTAQPDRRPFSEGNVNNNNPLFNIGTSSGSGGVDLFFRQQPSAAEIAAGYGDFGAGSHIVSAGTAYNNTWHHVMLVQQADGTRTLYLDGVADSLAVPAKPAGNWNVNATSIGGILRQSAAAWVTALIDDVALWKRALTPAEIAEVHTNGLNSVFSPLAVDLVSHWPLDTVVGDKTPDLISGYDMSAYVGASHTLTNGSAIVLTSGYRSNCVSFDVAKQTLLGYIAGPADDLPINKHAAMTVSFWVNAPTMQPDRRPFSEGNVNNNNPLFNIGTSSGSGGVDLFFRQQPSADEIAAGYGNFGAGSHIVSAGTAYDNTWHHVMLVQQADGTRTLYLDGIADSLAVPAKPAGNWNVNATSIGGILRQSAAAWVTALIDDVAVWKRALTPAEVLEIKNSGVPPVPPRKRPLQIRRFIADRASVVAGDTVVLSWDANFDASLAIGPGVGNVTAQSAFGVGSTTVVVNATTTFTLTASRGSESTNLQTTVNVVTGVAAGWRVIDNFEFLNPGHIGGQGGWQNALTAISGALRPANVIDSGNSNKFLAFDGENVLAGKPLNSMTITLGQTNTFFFRFYIFPEVAGGPQPAIDVKLGITEKGLRDIQDFQGANNGPGIRIFRPSVGPIDLQANNGVGPMTTYSYVADSAHNPGGGGLEPGKVYDVWMDIENRPFDIVAGVQNGGDRYSLHMQKQGDPTRTTLFQGFLSDRDGVTDGGVLGQAIEPLTQVFIALNVLNLNQGTNKVRLDDFFLSRNGINDTVPVPAGAFLPPLRITRLVHSPIDGARIYWNAVPGRSYTINKKVTFDEPWSSVPFGVATEEMPSYQDLDGAFFDTGFYEVIEEP
jgi:hypothetical protein